MDTRPDAALLGQDPKKLGMVLMALGLSERDVPLLERARTAFRNAETEYSIAYGNDHAADFSDIYQNIDRFVAAFSDSN